MNKNLILVILFFVLNFLISCSTEVEINAEYKEIPIVFCVLDPSLLPKVDPDTNDRLRWQYVKVNKAFLTNQSISEAAKISDSLFFENVNVFLAEYKNGSVTRTWTFEKTDDIPKEEGFFANDRNTLYRQKIDFGNYDNNTEYDLIVDVNGKHHLTGKTKIKLINGINMTEPRSYDNMIRLELYTATMKYKYNTGVNSSKSKIEMQFNYFDVKDNDTIYKSVILPLNEEVSGSDISNELNIGSFYSYLQTQIAPLEDGYIRLVKMPNSIEFNITSVDDEYYTYTQVTQPSTGLVQHKPVYSNINGGYGLFASRNNYTRSYQFSRASLALLVIGDHTKHLGFASEWNDYYFPYFNR